MSDINTISPERLKILATIKEYESKGLWSKDVEKDPPAEELLPEKIDYLNKKLFSKIATTIANAVGTYVFEKMIKNKRFIIKDVKGVENFNAVSSGAIITCNHFNLRDHYAVWRAIKPFMGKKRLWKVIKEGNYTNPPKPFGFIMKNCNTLPLSRNVSTMKNFLFAVKTLLSRGEKILIYPEQSMWWNYKKPRPLQNGAFNLAVKNNSPIIPIFITMKDSNIVDDDGSFVQEYYINILPAIYPYKELSAKENIENLKEKNYLSWKAVYEDFYCEKLVY